MSGQQMSCRVHSVIRQVQMACESANSLYKKQNKKDEDVQVDIQTQEIGVNTQKLMIEEEKDGKIDEEGITGQYNLQKKKEMDTSESEVAFQNKQDDQRNKLTVAFQASYGTTGEETHGIFVNSYFLTVKNPKQEQRNTVTININNKDYISKSCQQWSKFGRVNMIPLKEEPEGQLIIVNISNLTNQILFCFSKKDGKTVSQRVSLQSILLKQQKVEINRIVLRNKDFILQLLDGCPIMALYKGKPALVCLSDSQTNQASQADKFNIWIFKPNLDEDKMKYYITLKAQIARKQAQVNFFENNGTESNSIIFGQSQRETFNTNHSPTGKIYKLLGDKQKQGLQVLKGLQQEMLQDEYFSMLDIWHVCCLNRISSFPGFKDLIQWQLKNDAAHIKKDNIPKNSTSDKETKYKGIYNTNNALKKVSRKKRVDKALLNILVDRNYWTMKLVSSWAEKHHLLAASNFDYYINNGSHQFYYQSDMCECGCEGIKKIQHEQNIIKEASTNPLGFIAAALGAIIQLLKKFIIHNDIAFRNFIFIKKDWYLMDFDVSCFVKDVTKLDHQYQKKLHTVNIISIALNQQVQKKKDKQKDKQKEEEEIDLFFKDMKRQQNLKDPFDILDYLNKNRFESSWNQFNTLVNLVFKKQCTINPEHKKQLQNYCLNVNKQTSLDITVFENLLAIVIKKEKSPSAVQQQ